jgi:citrate lyase subunit beta / citryl-CoA lyase
MAERQLTERCLLARSALFVPGSRPDRFDKAAAAGADLVILDLEDSVAPDIKLQARTEALHWLGEGHAAAVRVNDLASRWGRDDVAAVAGSGAILMLPKATADAMDHVRSLLADDTPILALVETARGVMELPGICAVAGPVRLCFGSIDYALELGLDQPDGPIADDARARIAVASAASGLAPPMDGVTVRMQTPGVLSDDIAHARRFGFGGKLVVHPMQVRAVNEGFTPSAEQASWARGVLDAAENRGSDGAVFSLDGQMVDRPVIERARRIVAGIATFARPAGG